MKKTHLFNKRIIFWVAEKCCRNVVAVRYDRRARRAERAGRSFIGIGARMRLRRSETFYRTREGYPGLFSSSGQPPTLFRDPPPQIRLQSLIFAANPSLPDLDPAQWIWTVRSPDLTAEIASPTSSLPHLSLLSTHARGAAAPMEQATAAPQPAAGAPPLLPAASSPSPLSFFSLLLPLTSPSSLSRRKPRHGHGILKLRGAALGPPSARALPDPAGSRPP